MQQDYRRKLRENLIAAQKRRGELVREAGRKCSAERSRELLKEYRDVCERIKQMEKQLVDCDRPGLSERPARGTGNTRNA